MLNPLDLTGRRFLVTGASSGIGRTTAILLSRLGASIVLTGRDQARLAETLSQLDSGEHSVFAADIADVESVPKWLKDLVATTGPLHGLVHSAGLHAVRPLRFTGFDQFDEIVRVNVTAAVALSKGFRQKQVRAETGSVVFVASVMALVGQSGVGAYCASKGAVLSLTRALALELASENIRVNAVAPGQVITEMTERQRSSLTEEQFAAIEKLHPLGLGRADDVANAIAFLLSDASRWITGSTLVVDGGYTVH